ncbi:MAG: carbon starvation CstA family protein [Chloroflexota bacterium]
MNALIILLLAALGILIGYGLYARSIDRRVIQPDPGKATPATMYMDGVDFTPANRNVLFGYQFKSIAALGPIIGPIVAVRWGWLPALLWIILGTFFIGWVQDYSSIVMGIREEGKTFGALSYKLIAPRARTILLIFIYLYLLLIMGAFGKIVGFDLLTNPAVPLGVLLILGLGLLAGQMTYRWKIDILVTTVVTVVLAVVGIWLGTLAAVKDFFTAISGGAESPVVFGSVTWAQVLWSLVALVICYFGAVLPIWRFAQPITYVAFWIVFLGIIGGTVGLLIWHPAIDVAAFPVFSSWNGKLGDLGVLGSLWPLLFVTIACGAISGWHSLVSSSGTARQLQKEVDALPVGGGAMFLEMFLATISLLAAAVGVGAEKYVELAAAGKNAGIFAVGLSTFLTYIGVPTSFGLPYGSVFLVLMALPIMYLDIRFMRVASAEFLGDSVPIMKNVHVGSVIALLLSLVLIWTGFWNYVWILFGSSNQLMAALALLLASLWLMSKGKSYLWTFIPFIFMFVTTMSALALTAYTVLKQAITQAAELPMDKIIGNYIAGILGIILFLAALYLAVDAVRAIRVRLAEGRAPAPAS